LAEFSVQDDPAPWLYVIYETLCVCSIYGLVANLLGRRVGRGAHACRLSDLIWLLVFSSVAPMVVAGLYYVAIANAGLIDWGEVIGEMARYWMADSLGIVATLPAALVLATSAGRAQLSSLIHRWETLLQVLAVLGLLLLIFEFADQGPVRYFFVMFLPLIWAAARHGLLGASVAVFVLLSGMILLIEVHDAGVGTLFELQARALGLAITALVLGVAIDERRRTQERLEQSMRMAAATEMAAALAHELNQPLTALVGYGKACELLIAHERVDHTELERTVGKVTAQAQRIATIVGRLRDFLRSGRMQLEQVRVEQLIARAQDTVAAAMVASGVRMELKIDPNLPAVLVDRVEIEIVLRNLLANAEEAIRESATVNRRLLVRAQPWSSGFVCISVIDSGPGISAQIEDRLFSPLATTKPHGMGMGLAVSRAIVEAHGGRLWAETSEHGVFHLTLPTTQGVSHGGRG
jgi:signal transduction histidine kinase